MSKPAAMTLVFISLLGSSVYTVACETRERVVVHDPPRERVVVQQPAPVEEKVIVRP